MTAGELMEQLALLQDKLLEIITGVTEQDYRTQYHPDLSPLGWHLGHCVFTEIYWLRETVLGEPGQSDELKSFYIPELSPKTHRGYKLPSRDELCRWAEHHQHDNLACLRQITELEYNHELLRNHFLINFLVQHYAQHHETMQYILTQRALQASVGFKVDAPLLPTSPAGDTVRIRSGTCPIGVAEKYLPYDNEHPAFEVSHEGFDIQRRPVSNGEYLAFMESGGYTNDALWSVDGLAWRSENSVNHPDHWRKDVTGRWYGHDASGPVELLVQEPVYGVSYYEAEAYACWAGGRLAHEHEWEIAGRGEHLVATGDVWEWSSNAFYPYEGFKAFPYQGYSVPYFDNKHFTLKGGSRCTHSLIKRHTFRNYFEAGKRHHYAGIRVAFDQP